MAGIALMREMARGDVIRELAFTGRQFSGEEAVPYGFATAVHADPLDAARKTAREIAERSPDAVRALKRLLNASADLDAAAILMAESREQASLVGSGRIRSRRCAPASNGARRVSPTRLHPRPDSRFHARAGRGRRRQPPLTSPERKARTPPVHA